MPAARRFPPPWDIEEANASCFIVKDNNGQALAYVYFESDPGRRTAANPLTRRLSAAAVSTSARTFMGRHWTPAGRSKFSRYPLGVGLR